MRYSVVTFRGLKRDPSIDTEGNVTDSAQELPHGGPINDHDSRVSETGVHLRRGKSGNSCPLERDDGKLSD